MINKRTDFLRDSLGVFDKTDVFAIIAIQKFDGAITIRPIGGNWDTNIDKVIEQIRNDYPNCSLKIFSEDYAAYEEYCKPFGFDKNQYLS